jgi:colanic acid/amylovoran biosynthesis glycosyltransferase
MTSLGPVTSRAGGAGALPAAVIYTHSLLEGSMTFIRSHAEALTRHVPVYAGSHWDDGIRLPRERSYVVNGGSRLGLLKEGLFRKWGWAPGFIAALREHRPSVVHVHFGNCAPAGMTIADQLGTPLVVTFHGKDATQRNEEMRRSHRGRELLSRKERLIERTGRFIAVSEYIRTRLLEQGYPEDKVVVHRNGIDLSYFDPGSATSQRAPIVVFVGRFVEKKGGVYLLEAARLLRERRVEFQLVMIGAGPLEAEFRAYSTEHSLPSLFTGFISPEQIRDWLGRASVVAIPSVTAANGDSEGLPTVLLEAQAMKAPVVSTFHSGIPEGVQQGITADLVAERDATGLADRLQSLLEDPAKVRSYGDAGRAFVARNFDLRTQVAGLEAIYQNLAIDE